MTTQTATDAAVRPPGQISATFGPDPHSGKGTGVPVNAGFTVSCGFCGAGIRRNKTGLCRDCWLKRRPRNPRDPQVTVEAAVRLLRAAASAGMTPGDNLGCLITAQRELARLVQAVGAGLTDALGPDAVAEDLSIALGENWTRQRVWNRWGAGRD